MKKLNAIHFSAAKELTKGEQKLLKGGTEKIHACTCRCFDLSALWNVYNTTGICTEKFEEIVIQEYCGGEGYCD